ncbi:metallophosphoesterase family protein [Limnoglobus roseus]|nr:metallophosphoesterase [Limnoglobus roseus]
MKRLAWLTDIHLNFLSPPAVDDFLRTLADTKADGFAITGDIAEGPDVVEHLEAIAESVKRPVYFVLGNHDFYRGSIAGVREKVRDLCAAVPNLHWMTDDGVIPLTENACLVGVDGWGDGRVGDYDGSTVMLNDWDLIEEFDGLKESKFERLKKLNALGDDSADRLRLLLPEALTGFRHVVALTHVPPFREACWHDGKVSGEDWLPHFTCKAVGDVMAVAMAGAPDRDMTVLCGHTHGGGEVEMLPNLHVLTGGAEYRHPVIQHVLEVD